MNILTEIYSTDKIRAAPSVSPSTFVKQNWPDTFIPSSFIVLFKNVYNSWLPIQQLLQHHSHYPDIRSKENSGIIPYLGRAEITSIDHSRK